MLATRIFCHSEILEKVFISSSFYLIFLDLVVHSLEMGMVNKCVVYGCTSGYKTNKEKVSSLEFPIKRPQLMEK